MIKAIYTGSRRRRNGTQRPFAFLSQCTTCLLTLGYTFRYPSIIRPLISLATSTLQQIREPTLVRSPPRHDCLKRFYLALHNLHERRDIAGKKSGQERP